MFECGSARLRFVQRLPESDGIGGVRIGLERDFFEGDPSKSEKLVLTQICDAQSVAAWEEVFAKSGRGTVVHYAGNGVATLDSVSGESVRDLVGLWIGVDACEAIRLGGEPSRIE